MQMGLVYFLSYSTLQGTILVQDEGLRDNSAVLQHPASRSLIRSESGTYCCFQSYKSDTNNPLASVAMDFWW